MIFRRNKGQPPLHAQLQDYNDRMRNLLQSSDYTTASRSSRGQLADSNRQATDQRVLGYHPRRLHVAVSQAWQFHHASDVASLQLWRQTSEQVQFDVLFDVVPSPGHVAGGKQCQDASTGFHSRCCRSYPQRTSYYIKQLLKELVKYVSLTKMFKNLIPRANQTREGLSAPAAAFTNTTTDVLNFWMIIDIALSSREIMLCFSHV